jgi:hypothetical protein
LRSFSLALTQLISIKRRRIITPYWLGGGQLLPPQRQWPNEEGRGDNQLGATGTLAPEKRRRQMFSFLVRRDPIVIILTFLNLSSVKSCFNELVLMALFI